MKSYILEIVQGPPTSFRIIVVEAPPYPGQQNVWTDYEQLLTALEPLLRMEDSK